MGLLDTASAIGSEGELEGDNVGASVGTGAAGGFLTGLSTLGKGSCVCMI